MILDGLRIMFIGMGIVFLILLFIVLAVPLSAKIIHAIEGPPKSEGGPPAATVPQDRGRLTAVISAAVAMFRKSK